MTTKFLNEIAVATASEVKTLEHSIKRAKALRDALNTAPAKRFLQAVADAFNAPFIPGASGASGASGIPGIPGAYYDAPSLYTAHYSDTLLMRIRAYKLESFKDDPLLHSMINAAERLLEAYPPVERPDDVNPETSDFSIGRPNRKYRYRFAIPLRARSGQPRHVNVQFVIDAYVSEASATCRVVEKEVAVPAATRTERVIVCD
jgi:hypothetical protein